MLGLLSCDLWHTLVALPDADRRRFEAARRGAWRHSLVGVGVGEAAARRRVLELEEHARAVQRGGRSLPIDAQAEWLGRAARARLDPVAVAREIGGALDRTRPRVAPGAREALRELRHRGIRTGLVSNILFEPGPAVHRLLDRTGLSPLLDAVVLSCELGSAKPAPEPFLRLLRRTRARAEEAAHVGDEYADVVGALAAGVAPIRFTGLATRLAAVRRERARRLPLRVPSIAGWPELPARLPGLVERARRQARAYRASATRSVTGRA